MRLNTVGQFPSVFAQTSLMEGAGEELLVILAVGLAFVLGYLAAIVCLWFLMRRLSRRAAIIGLGIALFMHAVPLVAVLFEIPQHPGQVGETIRRILPDALAFPLLLTVPLSVCSSLRLLRK